MVTKTNITILNEDKNFTEQDFNIVIVDENTTFRNQLASRLRLIGYYVEFATGGFHLLNMLEKENKIYHMVIMHNNMHDMSALEMTGLVRSFKSKNEMHILYLSRSVSEEDLKELIQFGISDFFQKPHEQHKVTEKVQKFFQLRKGSQSSQAS